MPVWSNDEEWQGLVDGSRCPICLRGVPLAVIAPMTASWLTMPERGPMAGYLCVVSRVHAVELHDLEVPQAEAFIRDVRMASKALAVATQAVKVNYEIHGNTLPHLHMHLYPRHRGDRFEGRTIDPKAVPQPVYEAGHYEAMRERILLALSATEA